MAGKRRQAVFLILAGVLAILSLGVGGWLFWLSGAVQLLLSGGLMLALTLATWWLWGRAPLADAREAGPERV